MRIYDGTVEDLHAVADLWTGMVKEKEPDANPDPDVWVEYNKLSMASGSYLLVVAKQEGRLIGFADGYAMLDPVSNKVKGSAQHLLVLPEYRGGTVGGRLIRQLVQRAASLGSTVLELQCSLDKVSTWERRGFTHEYAVMRKEK